MDEVEYLVCPTILLVEGIMNNLFYGANECAKFPESWNGRPVVVDHPELLGKPMHDVIHHTKDDGSKYQPSKCPIYAAFTDGEIHRVDDEVFWCKDGTSFHVAFVSTPP